MVKRRPPLTPDQQSALISALVGYMDSTGASVRRIAAHLEVYPGTVKLWLKGEKMPQRRHIEALCRLMGTTPESVIPHWVPTTPPRGESRPRGTVLVVDEIQHRAFAHALREHMREKGLSQVALARILDVPQPYISSWARMIGMPTEQKMRALLKEMGKTLRDIFPYGGSWEELTGKVSTRREHKVRAKRSDDNPNAVIIDAYVEVSNPDLARQLLRLLREAKAPRRSGVVARPDPLNN